MTKTSPDHADAAIAADRRPHGIGTALWAAWAWLAVYLAVFFLAPGGSEIAKLRLGFAWVSLLRPEDLVREWFESFSWWSIADRGVILLTAGAILCVALAAGWTCLRLLRVDRYVTRLEMAVFSTGVGLNLLSLATLALGLAGWLCRGAFLALALGTFAASGLLYWRRGCRSGTCRLARPLERDGASAWNWSPRWLWLMAPFVVAILLAAMMPPRDFDVREYHLQAPKEFYQTGSIAFLPHNVYANMPLGSEMPALVAMVVLGDWWWGALVGKTLIAVFVPLAALALYAAGCRFASPAAGIVAALVYVSTAWMAFVSSHGLVEGAFGFYLFAAFHGVLVWKELSHAPEGTAGQASGGMQSTTPGGVLAVAGFLAGGAVSTKYPAVVYCALPLAAYLAYHSVEICHRGIFQPRQVRSKAPHGSQNNDLRRHFEIASVRSNSPSNTSTGCYASLKLRSIARIGVFLLAVMLGCGLWFAKNAVLSGNPTYPLLFNVFGGETRTPDKDAQWRRAHQPPNYEPADFVRRGWDALAGGDWLNPLLVPLAALAFVGRRTRRLALLVGGYLCFVFAAWWLLTHRIDRFLVPALPLAALLAGLGATWNDTRIWRRTLVGFLALGLAFNLLLVADKPVTGDNRYLADLRVLRVDPQRVDPWHLHFNSQADAVTGLLLVGDAQPFDLEVPAVYNTVFDDSIFEQLARNRTPGEIRQALAERGISHIYVAWPEIARYRSPGNYGFTDFVQPRIFADLVAAGILEELPPLDQSDGQTFRVLAHP